jgi:murein DD-endopeptidase MepM/ murein hydrolase activator NlpD
MTGGDVEGWERDLNAQLADWSIDYRLTEDGRYTVEDRAMTASVLYGLGIAVDALTGGVAPALRTKVRNKRLSTEERARYDERADWRVRLRARLEAADDPAVHRLVSRVLSDDWGYHPGVHDGIDLICPLDALLYAPVRSRVIDARAAGWWGLGAQPSPGHPVSEGDGIIQLEVLVTVGPIREGFHLGFGHAEHARVDVGQTVDAGEVIGRAGFANASHVHFMVNRGEVGTRGVGTLDPREIVDFCAERG